MTILSNTLAETARPDALATASARAGDGEVGDYIALLKPRVMSLVVFTALVGMAVAHAGAHPVVAGASLLMIAVGAGASGCLNMWWDADVDALMLRTRGRPLPAGRLAREEALSFGLTLAVGSVLVLGLAANWAAAALLAFTIVFYVVVYSMWLKRATAQNIVIGGAAGALPPMIGQLAVSGRIGTETIILFLIIFLWTPPHFWALALVRSDDYRRAGIPMMPNVRGPDSTRRQILVYTLLLVPCGLAPLLFGFGGLAFAAVSVTTGLGMLALAVEVFRHREGESAIRAAQHLFGFSVLYLFLLFATLLAEHGLGLWWPVPGWLG